ncbi:MAG TPA: hypothetical protein VLW85_10990 [Myxococcales bacterium]|nr:hypothetical protein [Myxococcales bacterium]
MIAVLLLAASLPFTNPKSKDHLSDEEVKKLEALPERTRQLITDAADNMILGSATHLRILLSLDLPPQGMELVLQDNCILCHSDPGNVKPRVLFSPDPAKAGSNPLLNLKELVNDAHFRRGLSCAGCHGGTPKDESMSAEIATRWPKEDVRHKDRTWIPDFCARCHSDPNFMRGFNPTMPTDQLAKYKDSKHGILVLQQHDSNAAQCVSCHGVHGIRGPKSRNSTVNAQRIPDTCGKCHADPQHMAGYKLEDGSPIPTDQVALYKISVHGKALLEKNDLGAPACTGCHGSHAAMPPAVASVAQVCRRCHVINGQLFDGSKHKVAFEQHKWPECGQCHGKHGIQKPSDALIGDKAGNLCHECHAVYSKENQACDRTAASFRATLDELSSGRAEIAPLAEGLAEKGLDVEPLSRAVGELDEAMVQTRTRVHSFDLGTFQQAATPAKEALEKGRQSVATARADYRFRQRGLLLALGSIGLLAIGIALKLRDAERRRNGK